MEELRGIYRIQFPWREESSLQLSDNELVMFIHFKRITDDLIRETMALRKRLHKLENPEVYGR